MKILLVQPANTQNKNFINTLFKKIKITSWPPLTLQQVAALTPNKHDVQLIDDNFESIPYEEPVDLVGVTARTCSVCRAYEIADNFQKQSIPVVLGGYHASGLPKEAKQHADSVVIGDAETIWPRLLQDFENGHMKDFYQAKNPPNPSVIPIPKRNIGRSYLSFTTTLQASRGCPHHCEFCALSNIPHGAIFRPRPINHLIQEIEEIKNKFLVFVDPSALGQYYFS